MGVNMKENKIPATIAGTYVAMDVELFQMERRRLHRLSGEFASLAVTNGQDVYLITDPSLVPEMLKKVEGKIWFMHNAGFDLYHLRRWTNIPILKPRQLHDTMIWERLLWNGYFTDFGLEDLCRRYLNRRMDKTIRKKFEKAEVMTAELKQYAVEDVVATFEIGMAQLDIIENENRDTSLYNDIEAPLIEIIPKFRGFAMNRDRWERLAIKNEKIANDFKRSLDFNPASPKQVKDTIIKAGCHLSDTQATTLKEVVTWDRTSSAAKQIATDVLEFRAAAKLAGTYGLKFLEHFLEDGRIYAHYWTIGASTGRMASADPNMQNIPAKKEFRSCFIASDGYLLTVADYAHQEVCILAHLSQDAGLIALLKQGGDPHLRVARKLYGEPRMKASDPRRAMGKVVNLGMPYGMTSYGISKKTGIPERETETLLRNYFLEFPGVEDYMKHYRYIGSRDEYIETIAGRRMWLNQYNKQWLNHAINAPIQGGAADQTKLALVLLDKRCKKLKIDYPVLAVVHDEIVAEFPEDYIEEGTDLVVDCMIEAGQKLFPSVPWKVDCKTGKDWGIKS